MRRNKSDKYWDWAFNTIAGMLIVGGVWLLIWLFVEYTLPSMGYK